MHAVASAEGCVDLLPIEHASIAAIQRHLMGLAEPLDCPGRMLPGGLAAVIDDPDMRLSVLRVLTMLPFIDQKVMAEKARVVDRVASMFGVQDSGLIILHQAVKQQYRRITFGILQRAIRRFWSSDGKARPRDWADMIMVMLPVLTPGRRRLRDKYQALEQLRPGSLGHVLYSYYRSNGFRMPGEPKSFPEKFVLHEIYHIFGSYPVNHHGEMLAAAFTGGNTDQLCMDMILLSLLQYQVGVQVAGVTPGMPGRLVPDEFFHAIARGAAMRVNLMDGWDFWEVAEQPLESLKAQYELPPLTGQESFEPLLVPSV